MLNFSLNEAIGWSIVIFGIFILIWLAIRLYFEEKEKYLDRVMKKMDNHQGDES